MSDTALQAGDHAISYSENEKKIFCPIFPTAKSISNLFRYKEEDSLLLLSITNSQLIVGLFHRLNVIIIWCQR